MFSRNARTPFSGISYTNLIHSGGETDSVHETATNECDTSSEEITIRIDVQGTMCMYTVYTLHRR